MFLHLLQSIFPEVPLCLPVFGEAVLLEKDTPLIYSKGIVMKGCFPWSA